MRNGLSISTAVRGARKAPDANPLWCGYIVLVSLQHSPADCIMMVHGGLQVIHPYRYLGYRVFGRQYLGDIWCANKDP
jgi:hypothetical protein